MGRCKSPDLLKSFFWYAPLLSRASTLFFPILSPLRVHRWQWFQWLRTTTSFVYWLGRQHFSFTPKIISCSDLNPDLPTPNSFIFPQQHHFPIERLMIFKAWWFQSLLAYFYSPMSLVMSKTDAIIPFWMVEETESESLWSVSGWSWGRTGPRSLLISPPCSFQDYISPLSKLSSVYSHIQRTH